MESHKVVAKEFVHKLKWLKQLVGKENPFIEIRLNKLQVPQKP